MIYKTVITVVMAMEVCGPVNTAAAFVFMLLFKQKLDNEARLLGADDGSG